MSNTFLRWKHTRPLMANSGKPLAVYVLSLAALLSIYWLLTKSDADIFRIGFLGQWLLMIIIGGTGITEQYEQKNGGYAFMRLLPIRNKEIVAAKLINVFLAVGFILCVQSFLLSLTNVPRELLALGRVLILISALAALLLVALFYLLIYRFGLARFVKAAWLLVILVMAGPILVVEVFLLPKKIDLGALHQFLIGIPAGTWILVTCLSLLVFIVLGRIAVHVKSSSDGTERTV